MKTRRSAVLVLPNSTVGHELVFRHHTDKVVVGSYGKPSKFSGQSKHKEKKQRTLLFRLVDV
jgi:hypothetical protein